MSQELLFRIALTLVPQIGDVQTRLLLQRYGEASSVFRAPVAELEKIEGIGPVRAESIRRFRDFGRAEQEVLFVERHGIQPLYINEPHYPRRLLHCPDAPALLFYKGKAELNASRVISVIGTRTHTEYGKAFTQQLMEELSGTGITVISGLAYGIDSLAHKAALKNGLPTIGVTAHGLDIIYPPLHSGLAKDMVQGGGGILTEFLSGTLPDRHHFPLRNRIVAGLADATLVVETGRKGGSMITAKLADSYNRDVFAVPGRVSDSTSSGCNYLIQLQKAVLLTGASDLLRVMGWEETAGTRKVVQKALFTELNPEEQNLVTLLQEKETMHIDELNARSGLPGSAVAAALLQLELHALIAALPGRMYRLV